MKSFAILAFIASAWAVAGCTAIDASTEAQEARTEPVWTTGSNIARHKNSGEVSVMSQQGYEQTRMPPPIPQAPGGGH
jgi:hypothetical protein